MIVVAAPLLVLASSCSRVVKPAPPRDAPEESVSGALPDTVPGPVACATHQVCTIAWRVGGRELRASTRYDEGSASVEVAAPGQPTSHDLLLGEGVRVEGLRIVDVTGDGMPDLIVQIDPKTGPAHSSARSTFLYAMVDEGASSSSGAFAFEELQWTETALGVVAADADLRGVAYAMRSFAMPDAKLATESVVLRMAFASAAELRAIVSARGLDICEEHTGNFRPHMRQCKHVAPAALTPKTLESVHMPMLDDKTREPTTPMDVQPCSQRGVGASTVTTCAQGTGGPANLVFVFTGTGAERRLVELTSSAYEGS